MTIKWTTASLAALSVILVSCGADDSLDFVSQRLEDGGLASAAGGNQPPELIDVVIRPSAPRRGDTLQVEARVRDADDDPITLHYEWQVDGRRVEATTATLSPALLGQGQEVEVIVTARDGMQASESRQVSVRLGNQPPMMLGVELHPKGVVRGDQDLTARAQATDPEGDPIEFSYSWTINDSTHPEDSDVLSAVEFKRGDRVTAAASASDGMHTSDPMRSDSILVENATPQIVSTPSGFGPDGIFRYRIQVEDADGDSRFGYRLIEGPEGMVIDSLDGQMVWKPRESQAGVHMVQLEVDDRRGGKTTQSFKLELTFEETAVPAAGSW